MNIDSELLFKQDGLVRSRRRLDSRDVNKLPAKHNSNSDMQVDGDVSPNNWMHINSDLLRTFLHPQVCYSNALSQKKQKDTKKVQKISCFFSI